MNTQNQIEAMVEKVIDLLNRRDLDAAFEAFDPGFINHELDTNADETLEQHKAKLLSTLANLPDFKVVLEETVSQGTLESGAASMRFLCTGTGKGLLGGVSIEGKQVKLYEFITYHIRNGKIVEGWTLVDLHAFLTQLGLI